MSDPTPQHPAAPEGEHRPNGCCDFHRHIADGCCHCDATAAPEGETDASGLRELLRLATPAPWGVASVDGQGFAVHRGEHETVALYCDRDNARLIAAAVNALPALLADLDAARERVRVVEGERDRWQDKAQEAGEAYGLANSRHHEELDRANRLERLADRLAERAVELEDDARAATARAESAEAAHEALRAGVEALADQFDGYGHGVYCTHMEEQLPCSTCRLLADLRALLLAGGGA